MFQNRSRIGYWRCRTKEFRLLKDEKEGGILEFGTEVINTDGSLAVLLGASPGASTAVSIMADLVDRCSKQLLRMTAKWFVALDKTD
jgi:malate dehydrogenase (quinone)